MTGATEPSSINENFQCAFSSIEEVKVLIESYNSFRCHYNSRSYDCVYYQRDIVKIDDDLRKIEAYCKLPMDSKEQISWYMSKILDPASSQLSIDSLVERIASDDLRGRIEIILLERLSKNITSLVRSIMWE